MGKPKLRLPATEQDPLYANEDPDVARYGSAWLEASSEALFMCLTKPRVALRRSTMAPLLARTRPIVVT